MKLRQMAMENGKPILKIALMALTLSLIEEIHGYRHVTPEQFSHFQKAAEHIALAMGYTLPESED